MIFVFTAKNLLNESLYHFLPGQRGVAYIYNCPYSTLCRQVVTDEEGRVKEFDFDGANGARVKLNVSIDQSLTHEALIGMSLTFNCHDCQNASIIPYNSIILQYLVRYHMQRFSVDI